MLCNVECVRFLVSFCVYLGGEPFFILFVIVGVSSSEGVSNFVCEVVFTKGVFVWCVYHKS